MAELVPVASLSQLQQAIRQTVEVKGKLVALFWHNERVYAIDDACPHMGGPLSNGDLANGIVRCPWHGWQFRLETGVWADAPNTGTKLNTYATKIDGDQIFLEV